jgi:phosphoserine aminotransferase
MVSLVLDWLSEDIGGLQSMSSLNTQKSKLVYDAIQNSQGFYSLPVVSHNLRSRMNIPFRIAHDYALENEFVDEAKAVGIVEVKGHRSVGGLRVSLYNAMDLEGVLALVEFMGQFREKHLKN